MNILVNRICHTLLALTAVSAVAQAGQATFHLPFAAQWGAVALPPGDYKVAVPDLATSASRQLLVQGEDTKGFVLPNSTDIEALMLKPSDKNYLQLVKVDGTYYVTKYQSGRMGVEFTFRLPKPKYQVEVGSRQTVDVDVATK